jgi:O-antigen/teichoic acid export membrane protein
MIAHASEFLHSARTPLYANAYALVANQIASAGLGFVYWVLAARLYGAATVGASSAVISTLLLISGISQLGLGGGMTRFLPRAGLGARRLILLSYAAVVATSVVLGLAFVALGGALGLRGVLGNGPLLMLWAVLAAVLWSIFRLQDAVLIGLRQAKWVLIENTIYNVAKILLLWAGASLLADGGIVGSWFLPTPLVIALVTWLVFGVYTRSNRSTEAAVGTEPLTLREVATTSGGDHVGSLVTEAATRLLPVIVVTVLGAATTAYFYTAWLVATTLGLIAGSMTDSFTAEAAGDRPNINHYSRQILRPMAALTLSAAAVLAIAAPLVLRLFGTNYAAEGATLLRWLCLSSPLIVFNNWYFAYARVMGRIHKIVWLQTVAAALLLGVSYALLRPVGISGVGIAWLVSQGVVTIFGFFDSRGVLFGPHPVPQGGAR